MHGNTIKHHRFKTRTFESVLKEVEISFVASRGNYAGGLHVEMTGQDVTDKQSSKYLKRFIKQI